MYTHASDTHRRSTPWLVNAVHEVTQLFSRWRSRRETYIRLMSLDDRLLQDIDLTRADIWSAARGDFPRTAANTNTPKRNVA